MEALRPLFACNRSCFTADWPDFPTFRRLFGTKDSPRHIQYADLNLFPARISECIRARLARADRLASLELIAWHHVAFLMLFFAYRFKRSEHSQAELPKLLMARVLSPVEFGDAPFEGAASCFGTYCAVLRDRILHSDDPIGLCERLFGAADVLRPLVFRVVVDDEAADAARRREEEVSSARESSSSAPVPGAPRPLRHPQLLRASLPQLR